jgi:signal transduction histidine kinase
MRDFTPMNDLFAPVRPLRPSPIDAEGLVERLRLSALSLGYALAMAPALALALLTILAIPLGVVTVGFVIALAAVPATAALTRAHRTVTGSLLGEQVPTAYADTTGTNVVTRPLRWLGDPARWRDFGFLCFSATGGFVLSLVPAGLLAGPLTYAVMAVVDGGWVWLVLVLLGGPMLLVWWLVTPALVTARLRAERAMLGHARVARLEQRVETVEETRAETLDHSAAEVRRIERDLHDGAQARIAAVGMNVGLAEQLLTTDPDAAAALLREARATTVDALEDLRSVVRGIHPPVLADRGLPGAIEALAMPIPLPVTVAVTLDHRLPDPVESAAYFAVAECLANAVKHASASRAWITGSYDGQRLRLAVGDDGVGAADPAGGGLAGVARRLAAFDGTLTVDSPPGGPTIVTLEVPCRT